MDPDLFYPGLFEIAKARQAVATCELCSVRADCLRHALVEREMFGIWGGVTSEQRRRLRRQIRRGEAVDAVIERALARTNGTAGAP